MRNLCRSWRRCSIGAAALLMCAATHAFAQSNAAGFYAKLPALPPICLLNGVQQPCFNVTGTWTVPTVRWSGYSNPPQLPCLYNDSPCEDVSVWIGIDGASTNTLIQLGTAQDVSLNGQPASYYAWYELLPTTTRIVVGSSGDKCASTCLKQGQNMCPVGPGDTVAAQITSPQNPQDPSAAWALHLTNHSKLAANNWSWSCANLSQPSSQNTAEWYVEAPIVSQNGVKTEYPLPNFGKVIFSEVFANQLGTNWTLAQATLNPNYLQNQNGGDAAPCPPVTGATSASFAVVVGVECAPAGDFNGDGKSDIAWRDTGGDMAFWLMNGATVAQSSGVGNAPTLWSMAGQRDFNGDGKADVLWRDTSGDVAVWLMNGAQVSQSVGVGSAPASWSIAGTGDFNGDGTGAILWRDGSGSVAIWELSGGTVTQSCGVGNAPTTWSIAGTADFNGDGATDILWHDNSGNVAIWFMNGCTVMQSSGVGNAPTNWSIAGTGDFNNDGMSDILWHDSSGNVAIWEMNGATVSQSLGVGNAPTKWSIAKTGDFNGDGMSDILWHDTAGNVAVWLMNGGTVLQSAGVGNAPTIWSIQQAGAD